MRAAYLGLRIGAPMRLRHNPIVLGRKFCAECGRWRAVHEFALGKRNGATLASYCFACARQRARESYHAAHPPEWWESRREYSRIYQQTKRRERGVPERSFRRPTVIDRVERVFLPLGPLLAELERAPDFSALAKRAGTSERSLLRLRNGGQRVVQLDLADRLAVALGIPLFLLYGDQPVLRVGDIMRRREPA